MDEGQAAGGGGGGILIKGDDGTAVFGNDFVGGGAGLTGCHCKLEADGIPLEGCCVEEHEASHSMSSLLVIPSVEASICCLLTVGPPDGCRSLSNFSSSLS